MKPAARREAAGYAHRQYGLSVRHACRLTECFTSTYYYRGHGREDEPLRKALNYPSGKPTKNAYIESYNSIFRDDCLNQHWFTTLDDARRKIAEWKEVYNTVRPHGSLGRLTPEEFALTG